MAKLVSEHMNVFALAVRYHGYGTKVGNMLMSIFDIARRNPDVAPLLPAFVLDSPAVPVSTSSVLPKVSDGPTPSRFFNYLLRVTPYAFLPPEVYLADERGNISDEYVKIPDDPSTMCSYKKHAVVRRLTEIRRNPELLRTDRTLLVNAPEMLDDLIAYVKRFPLVTKFEEAAAATGDTEQASDAESPEEIALAKELQAAEEALAEALKKEPAQTLKEARADGAAQVEVTLKETEIYKSRDVAKRLANAADLTADGMVALQKDLKDARTEARKLETKRKTAAREAAAAKLKEKQEAARAAKKEATKRIKELQKKLKTATDARKAAAEAKRAAVEKQASKTQGCTTAHPEDDKFVFQDTAALRKLLMDTQTGLPHLPLYGEWLEHHVPEDKLADAKPVKVAGRSKTPHTYTFLSHIAKAMEHARSDVEMHYGFEPHSSKILGRVHCRYSDVKKSKARGRRDLGIFKHFSPGLHSFIPVRHENRYLLYPYQPLRNVARQLLTTEFTKTAKKLFKRDPSSAVPKIPAYQVEDARAALAGTLLEAPEFYVRPKGNGEKRARESESASKGPQRKKGKTSKAQAKATRKRDRSEGSVGGPQQDNDKRAREADSREEFPDDADFADMLGIFRRAKRGTTDPGFLVETQDVAALRESENRLKALLVSNENDPLLVPQELRPTVPDLHVLQREFKGARSVGILNDDSTFNPLVLLQAVYTAFHAPKLVWQHAARIVQDKEVVSDTDVLSVAMKYLDDQQRCLPDLDELGQRIAASGYALDALICEESPRVTISPISV